MWPDRQSLVSHHHPPASSSVLWEPHLQHHEGQVNDKNRKYGKKYMKMMGCVVCKILAVAKDHL